MRVVRQGPDRLGAKCEGTPAARARFTENTVGAFCYAGGLFTGILFLTIAPYDRNPRIKFHAIQSILFHLVWIVAWVLLRVAGWTLPYQFALLQGSGVALWLFLIWRAYQGQTLSLPLIGSAARQLVCK